MRNVPMALAGAFLGLRGLLVCLGLAIAMRVGIGGVGVPAGVIGLMIAGGVGYGWALFKDRLPLSDAGRLVVLGAAMNLHMLSALAVPPDIMRWYFVEAAPTILVLNLTCVPALGWLLLREQRLTAHTAALSASAAVDPLTRLLPANAFAQEVAHFHASDGDRNVAGVLAVTLKTAGWLRRTCGDDAANQALGVLRLRINAALGDHRPLGIDRNRRILIPVTTSEMHDLRAMRQTLRRCASDTPFTVNDAIQAPLSVIMESFALSQPDTPNHTLASVQRAASARRSKGARSAPARKVAHKHTDASVPKGLCRHTYHRLFDETDAQMRRLLKQG